jgi:hypothetical protein
MYLKENEEHIKATVEAGEESNASRPYSYK